MLRETRHLARNFRHTVAISHEGVTTVFFNVPGSHQGSTPTRDPRVPGITSGGDGMEASSNRPHREILVVAMVLVLALSAFVAWVLFKPAGSDAAARASAVESGLTVSPDWTVKDIDGGFTVVRDFGTGGAEIQSGYYFDIVEATEVSEPADLSTWKPQISGAVAYAEGEPVLRVLIDAGEHSWVVLPRTLSIYAGDGQARAAWYDLANSISFAPEN